MVADSIGPLSVELIESQIKSMCKGSLTATAHTWVSAEDIMSEQVATVSPASTVAAAAHTMSKHKISCLIVADTQHLLCIITETDMVKNAVSVGSGFYKSKVEQIMSSPVRTIPRNLPVMEVGRIRETENIRQIIFVKEHNSARISMKEAMSFPLPNVFSDHSVLSARNLLKRVGIGAGHRNISPWLSGGIGLCRH